MATLAIRVNTVEATSEKWQDYKVVHSGHAYVLFSEPRTSVRDLIAEKVRAEARKARAMGNSEITTLDRLTGHTRPTFDGPLDDQLLVAYAQSMFRAGEWTLLVDGHTCLSLDEQIELTRRTCIQFVVRENNFEVQA